VVITPWSSLEADCLRHLIRDLDVIPKRPPDDHAQAWILTVPRKLSPWPLELPEEVAARGVPVVVVVDAVVPWSIAIARSVGASGLVTWADGRDRIVAAVEDALTGHRLSGARVRQARPDPLSRLTQRERQVMALVTLGQQDEMIASRLGISVNTVRSHVQHCLTKLDVTHRHAAASLVRNHRLALSGRERGAVPSVRTEF
jgi:DNA-binding CsgD family transcriptional regulator